MKIKKNLAMLLIFTVVIATSIGGCSTKKDTADLDTNQHLTISLNAEPESLDPSRAVDSYSSIVIAECQEALTRCEQDETGKDIIKAAGAKSWEVSKDGLAWTFKLRDNLWSDGKEVAAEDYKYGIMRTLDPSNGGRYSGLLNSIKGAEEYVSGKGKAEDVGVKAIDDKTLVFTLKSPCPYFINLTYFKLFTPQRKDYVEKYGEKFGADAESIPSSGPFVLKSWKHKSTIELEKNNYYWDKDSVKLSKLSYKILEDEQGRMDEILNGTVDIGTVEKKEWKDKFDSLGKFNIIGGYEPVTDYIFFNTKDNLFKNVKIRKAFSAAINREEYVKTLFPRTRVAAYGFIPPSLQIGEDDFRTIAGSEPLKTLLSNNTDVKGLFKEGLKELKLAQEGAGGSGGTNGGSSGGSSGVSSKIISDDPAKVTITLTAVGTNAKQKQIQEYFQQELQKNLGCQVKIDYVDGGAYLDKLKRGDFQATAMAWTGDYNDPMTFFEIWTSKSMMNFTFWTNKTYEDNINKAASTTDQAVRLAAFKENEDIIVNQEAVCVPLDYRQRSQYQRNYVKGYMSTLFGSGFECKYAYTSGRK